MSVRVLVAAMATFDRVSPAAKTYRPRIEFSEYVSGRAGRGDAEGPRHIVGALRYPPSSGRKNSARNDSAFSVPCASAFVQRLRRRS